MKGIKNKVIYFFSTIFLVLTTIFFVIRLAPGDPVERILGDEASEKEISWYREQLGLDRPISSQYIHFMKGFFIGDMGLSLFKKKPVSKLLSDHLTSTLVLATICIFFSTILGILGGMFSAIYKSSLFDTLLRIISLIFLSFPIFSLAPLLVLVFSIKLNILPVSEWGGLSHMVLPSVTLIIPLASILTRVVRNKYLEEINALWVLVLRSKGMAEKKIRLHILKVCLPTILNVVAIQLAVVLAGTMITESIFDIPGVGLLLFESIQNRDYPVVQGVVVYSTIIYMVVYFLVDFINEQIDPRIKEA
ncbi:MAG: ABC transporter permease [Halobacteriovoraceae bacterium]|nr:ABC transporter permease [Halobacteriovoraceae bacterium]